MKEKNMKEKNMIKSASKKLNLTVSGLSQERYIMRLYITGCTSRSALAIKNLKRICEEYLEGGYELEVVDLYQKPSLAQIDQIIASPTLVKRSPLPFRRIIGDMSDKEKILSGLGLKELKVMEK